jgi:hypothetical protein
MTSSAESRSCWRLASRGSLLGCLLVASGALGQTTGVVVGQVLDAATKASAAGVRVCAFSPSLIGMQLATTDETGWYRLAQLPPGLYVLVYEGREFQDETWGMDVRAGATLWRNVELCPAVAACDYFVVPGLRIHRTDSLVARGIDAVLPAACPPTAVRDAVVAETHRPRMASTTSRRRTARRYGNADGVTQPGAPDSRRVTSAR